MPKLLTPKEVAALFRCSVVTVRRWAMDGTIPSVRIGKILRFDEEAVKKALAGT